VRSSPLKRSGMDHTVYTLQYTTPAFTCILVDRLHDVTVIDSGRVVSGVLLISFCNVLCCIFTCVSYAEARNRYRLAVRPSVTRWYCIKTAERIVMLSSPHDSPFILFLCISRSSRNSDGVTPCVAAKQRWGVKISQFSTNNLLYLRNG